MRDTFVADTIPPSDSPIVYYHRRRRNSEPSLPSRSSIRISVQSATTSPRHHIPRRGHDSTMCTTNVYTYVHADGSRERVKSPSKCYNVSHGLPCQGNVVFRHPEQPAPYSSGATGGIPSPALSSSATLGGSPNLSSSPYLSHFPPTPTYTPRSNTPIYRSGDESDRSYHSASSASNRRGESVVYINGQRVLSGSRRGDEREAYRRHGRHASASLGEQPTYTTSPRVNFASSAPSSPNAGAPQLHRTTSERRHGRTPVVHYDQGAAAAGNSKQAPRVTIEITNDKRSRSHHRRRSSSQRPASSSSHEYAYYSSSSAASAAAEEDWEERQRRRDRREADRVAADEAARRRARLERVARANAEIANRPAVPPANTPSAPYTRGRVDIVDDVETAMRRMAIREEKRKLKEEERELRRQQDEQYWAQRQRLASRFDTHR
jgi:hypothetical protein